MSSWYSGPPPPSDNNDRRPTPQDLGHHQSYSAPQPYSAPFNSREGPVYPPNSAYSRPGSASAPTRPPVGSHQYRYPTPPLGALHEHYPYYQQSGLLEYHRPAYGAPEPLSNGTHPPLHVQTGSDMIPGQPGGPPSHQHFSAPVPPPGEYYFSYHNAAAQRRNPVRAAQACDSCRRRKAKCDEGRPDCGHCKDNSLTCSYRDIPPHKSEKQVMQIAERLGNLSDSVAQLIANQKVQQDHNKRQDDHNKMMQGLMNFVVYERHSDSAPAIDDDNTNFATPLKHTTAVYHLFEWPSIRALLPKNQSASYVMDIETARGLLRCYGCGEGEDEDDGHDGAPSPAGSSYSEGRRPNDEPFSALRYGVWGNGQLHTLQASVGSHTARENLPILSPRGGLMLDSEAVDGYYRAYMENIHILHPFLEPKVLRQMVRTFKEKYSWDYRVKYAVTGGKRKREATDSPSSTDEMDKGVRYKGNHARAANSVTSTNNIEHSIANAVILLVMALGQMCTHRQPIPGPVKTSPVHTSTPHIIHSVPSDVPFPTSAPTSPFSNQHPVHGNRAIAVSSPLNSQEKNSDHIPGLSYFARAANILGELPGGVDVSHIQVNLLAGLYMGQMARILPSHSYISVACRACQVLIESTDYKSGKMRASRRNLINFAFWSCLQLESDILAEVELPPSGITRYERTQLREIPIGVTLDQYDSPNSEDILRFYSYQIQLRRMMNEVHSALYQNTKLAQKPPMTKIEILSTNVDEWRSMLNDWNWNDDDHQSENVNVARMRAKYYGAKYIIHRPVLYYALQHVATPHTPSSKYLDSREPSHAFASSVQQPHYPLGRSPRPSEMGPSSRHPTVKLDPKIIQASSNCVEAAIRSTTSFDKVPRRLIITNIFGTAHAQFGNMLVLSATYTSSIPELSSLVSERTLRELFDRTIKILLEHEEISPVLKHDARILEVVRSNIFPSS